MMRRFTILAVCLVVDILLSMVFVAAYWAHRDMIVLRIGWVLASLYPVEIVAMCFFWHAAAA